MRTKILNISAILIILLNVLSCKNESYYEKKMKIQIKNKLSHEIKNLKAVVILPNQGCQGCISEVEQFMIHNANKNLGIKYVLTKIVSRKVLKNKIGDSIYYSKAVLIDSLNAFSSIGEKSSIYPSIFYIKDENFQSVEFQNPDNPNAMNNLLKRMREN